MECLMSASSYSKILWLTDTRTRTRNFLSNFVEKVSAKKIDRPKEWFLPFDTHFQMVIDNSCWSFYSKLVDSYRTIGFKPTFPITSAFRSWVWNGKPQRYLYKASREFYILLRLFYFFIPFPRNFITIWLVWENATTHFSRLMKNEMPEMPDRQ